MNADIVKQLRDRSLYVCGERPSRWEDDLDLLGEAADEIERLRAENERLRRAVTLNARFDTLLGGAS